MARLLHEGMELGELASGSVFGTVVGTVAVTGSNVRSGNHAMSITAASSWIGVGVGGAVSRTTYFRTYIRPTANPTHQIGILGVSTAAGSAPTLGEAYLETNGTVTLRLANGTALATSSAIPTGAYSMIEVSVAYPASGTSTLTLRVNGVTIGSGTGSATVFSASLVGNFIASAVGTTVLWDDIAINDSTGAANNNWCDQGKVVALWPVSDSSRTGFTGGAGGTTSLFDAVNNHPPVGVAVASATNTSQIKDATSNTTDNYVANMGAYSDSVASGGGGMGANDVVRSLFLFAEIGNSSTTARTAGVTLVTNPAESELTGSTSGAAGTYPSGWTDLSGTAVLQAPSVTLSSKPTVKFRKGTASTDNMMAAALVIMVDYAPAQAQTATDTSASSDSASRSAQSLTRTAADASASSDAATEAAGKVRTAADTSASSDSASRASTAWARTGAETSVSSDTAAETKVFSRTTSETSASSDAAVGKLGKGRTSSDTSASTDAATRNSQAFIRTTSETSTSSDSGVAFRTTVRTGSDTTSSSDAATRGLVQSHAGSDTSSTSDAAIRRLLFARITADTTASSDTATRRFVAPRTSSDTSNSSDVAADTLGPRTATDVSTTTDVAVGVAVLSTPDVLIIQLNPATTPVQVSISRPDLTPVYCPPNSPLSMGSFGLSVSGDPYFDTAGATPGEAGTLGWDGSIGHPILVTSGAPDPHLMMLAHAERALASRTLPRVTHPVRVGTADPVQQIRARARETLLFPRAPESEGTHDPAQQARALASRTFGRAA